MSTPETKEETTEQAVTTQGRVKWFNNRAGYGFITVSSGEHKNEDVFVHHSAVQVKQEQYRYLVQGEFVDFKLCAVSDEAHKWQAGEVSGVDGEKLMCETRLETRNNRPASTRDSSESRTRQGGSDQQSYRVRTRGGGPREGEEWMLVRRKPHNRNRQTDSPTRQVMRPRNTEKGNYNTLDNAGDN